ncbi:MAG TPA: 50S ribosomal protein L25 [Dehalococcoidia bacterium]|nr:50S ribosomal protein L25 [Dehalococcoidia bacterium]
MATKDLKAAPRTVLGKNVAKLRRAGVTPANIFGHKLESTAVQADTSELLHLMRGSSRNQIISLRVDGESAPRTVVVRDVARDPSTYQVLHVDFYQVNMTEKMRAQVQVLLTGASDAVETFGGVLLQMIETIEVEALPGDIPSQFEADVTVLTQLDQALHVRDLHIDETRITVHTDPDVVVARVAAPRLVTEEAAAEAPEGETPVGTETPVATETPAE